MTDRDAGDDPFRDWDATYVLGALSPDDRRAYEEHLRICDACRAAVGDLAGMPGLLRMVPADEALQLSVPDDGPAGEVIELATLAHATRRVHRRRLVGLVAAAAALLVIGGAAGAFVAHPGTPTASPSSTATVTTLALEPVGPVAITADLTLQKKAWGTRIDWECTYPADAWPAGDGPTYELVLVDSAGEQTVVATWSARNAGARGLAAASSMLTEDIRSVQIRIAGSDTPLATAQT